MSTRLLLVRHGQSDWNVEERFQGQQDRPLTDVGRQQAAQVADRLRTEPVAVIYSSPLQRSLHTAFAIAPHHNLPVTTDARLLERSWGPFEGLTRAQALAENPDLSLFLDSPSDHWPGAPPPGLESRAQLAERARRIHDHIVRDHHHQTVVVVSHGALLNAWLRFALGLMPEAPVHFKIGNASITELLLHPNGARTLQTLNEQNHLSPELALR